MRDAFLADVLAGLTRRPRAIPARWFYDAEGSALFECITTLPEYYPTRVELDLLERHMGEIADRVGHPAIVEFGSGSSTKTRILLRALRPPAYVPIDISESALDGACAALRAEFPDLRIVPVVADFTHAPPLPPLLGGMSLLGFLPGSTIGNFAPAPAVDLLRAMRDALGDAAWLLIGMDRIKDERRLLAAYDDAAGVTAAFNLNLLARINRELDGTIPLDAFAHEARWNADEARIEMHLRAVRDVAFTVAGRPFALVAGETIHTENSHKYSDTSARLLLQAGGWQPEELFTDADALFTIVLARAALPALAP